MLSILISIAGILLTIAFVIGTHEGAHCLAAKLLGVKVLRFSIGFGKTLLRWKGKTGTEYVIALIPLGGYVKMLDENEDPVSAAELPYAYNRQPYYKKFLIVLAGPLSNIVCALIIYWAMFLIGFVTIIPTVGVVTPGSIADQAGLKPNQEIIAIDGRNTQAWPGVLLRIIAHAGNQDTVKIETRDLKTKALNTHTLDLAHWEMNKLTPDPLSSLGIIPYEPPIPLVISMLAPDSPASLSPLKIGDKIIAINQKPVKDWNEIIQTINDSAGQTLIFTVLQKNKKVSFPVKIGTRHHWFSQNTGYLGIGPEIKIPEEMLRKIQYGPLTSFVRAGQELMDFTYFNVLLFGKLLTGKLPVQSLGGPITIFESAGTALNYGLFAFMQFLAFMSISIGIINLFPIPGLDGGHLFLQTVEAIIRRPIPEKILEVLYRAGLFVIVFVLIQSLANDLLRL